MHNVETRKKKLSRKLSRILTHKVEKRKKKILEETLECECETTLITLISDHTHFKRPNTVPQYLM